MYYTYILHSPSRNLYYIGQTGKLEQRLAFHAAGATPATACGQDWEVVFLEGFSTRKEAMSMERRLKRAKSHRALRRYIADGRNRVMSPWSLKPNDTVQNLMKTAAEDRPSCCNMTG